MVPTGVALPEAESEIRQTDGKGNVFLNFHFQADAFAFMLPSE